MGWLYTQGFDKSRLVADLRKQLEKKLIKSTVVGNCFWALINSESHGVIILLCLLQSGRQDGWGYKDMDESMHPYYYSCPLNYLEKAPVACQKWRDWVVKFHAEKSKKLEIGEYSVGGNWKVQSMRIDKIILESVKPLRGKIYSEGTFLGYSTIPRRMMKDAKPLVAQTVG